MLARTLASDDDGARDALERDATRAWWAEWWSKSSIDLGEDFALLQHWWETMMYLQRGSTRAGAVAPALWGPWSVSDSPSWGDEARAAVGGARVRVGEAFASELARSSPRR